MNPGASERLVQITGAGPDNIEFESIFSLHMTFYIFIEIIDFAILQESEATD